jgi:sigma-E factor negative regulatory protein RseA
MSEKLKEAVSAAIDDEADEFELRRVLDELPKNRALKAAWERYHLVSALLREEVVFQDDRLRERIWAELDVSQSAPEALAAAEPKAATANRPVNRLNRFTGVAVAATVAIAVVLIGVTGFDSAEQSAPGTTVAVAPTLPVTPERSTRVVSSSSVTDQDQARLAALMMAHTQQLGMNQAGPAAFTKLVTYQSR